MTVLLLAALPAGYLPATGAACIDPLKAMRTD